jgi:hypothetical protein
VCTISRIITCVLLVSLVLNMGDWPYVDEILSGVATHQSGTAGDASDNGEPDTSKPATSAQSSLSEYQKLAHMAGIPGSMLPAHVIMKRDFTAHDAVFPPSLFPDRVDRPPTLQALYL